jgi:hypothetical protein
LSGAVFALPETSGVVLDGCTCGGDGVIWHGAVAIVSAEDRDAWLDARQTRITSTDVAKAMTPSGWRAVVASKLMGLEHADNEYFAHGRDREATIGAMAERKFGLVPNRYLFDGAGLSATPDAVHPDKPELGEFKTSTKPLPKTTPRDYRDQVYIAQHVFGAERTLLGWEQHANGVPVDLEPSWRWIDRDQERIDQLLTKAGELGAFLRSEGLTLAY